MEELKELMSSNDEVVAVYAEELQMILAAFEEGQIEKDMVLSLCEDAKNSIFIDNEADELTDKSRLLLCLDAITLVL